jgi:hypothetical protein
MASAVMGKDGRAMGSGMAEQSQWAMGRRWRKMDAANAEAAQWEFGILDLCFFPLSSQLVKLPPAPDFPYSFGFS